MEKVSFYEALFSRSEPKKLLARSTMRWMTALAIAVVATSCNVFKPAPQTTPPQPNVGNIIRTIAGNAQTNQYVSTADLLIKGISSEGTLTVNKDLTLSNQAGLHANLGYTFNAKQLNLNGGSITAGTGATTCVDNTGLGLCPAGKPKNMVAPITVAAPDFNSLKASNTPTTFGKTVQGSVTLNSSADLNNLLSGSNGSLRITGSLTINYAASLENLTLVVDTNASFNNGATLRNSKVIATTLALSRLISLENSKLLSPNNLIVDDGLSLRGLNTLATAGNLTLNGDLVTAANPNPNQTAFIAQQAIAINGRGTINLQGWFWAGTTFTNNPTATITGGILARGNTTQNGALTLNKAAQVDTPDIPGGGPSSVTGTLEPGGTLVGPDGVRVSAPGRALKEPREIFVNRIIPTQEEVLDSIYNPIGSYYRVGAARYLGALDDPFIISLPIPSGVNVEGLRVAVQGESRYIPDYPLNTPPSWTISPEEVDTVNRRILLKLYVLDLEGFVIVIANPGNSATPQTNFNIQNQDITVECETVSLCNSSGDAQTLAKSSIKKAREDHIRDMRLLAPNLPRFKDKLYFEIYEVPANTIAKTTCQRTSFLAYYSYPRQWVAFCMSNGGVMRADSNGFTTDEVSRHEVFHAVQGGYVPDPDKNPFFPPISRALYEWFSEGTAEASVSSDSTSMNVFSKRNRRTVTDSVLSESDTTNAEYRFQDFWVYLDHKANPKRGLPYLKLFLETGFRNPLQDVDSVLRNSLGYANGLHDAYWEWAKNQAVEKNIRFRNLGERCKAGEIVAPITTGSDYTRNVIRHDLNSTTPTTLTNSEKVKSLTTRLVKVEFTNPTDSPRKVRVTISSPGLPDLRYKVYITNLSGKVLADDGITPRADCENVQDGTGNVQELDIRRNTQLVILVANTSFAFSNGVAQEVPLAVQIENLGRAQLEGPTLSANTLTLKEGETKTMTASVKNVGTAPMPYSASSSSGPALTAILDRPTVVAANVQASSLEPGQTDEFPVRVTCNTPKEAAQEVVVSANAGEAGTGSATLSVVCKPPKLSVLNANKLTSLAPNDATGSITVSNAAPLGASDLRGTISPVSPLAASPDTIALAATSNMEVSLRAPCKDVGSYWFSLDLETNDPTQPTKTVEVEAVCQGGKISDPDPVSDFREINQSWSNGLALYWNTGNADLVVSSITSNTSWLTITGGGTATVPKNMAGSVGFRATCPALPGIYRGSYTIHSNDPTRPTVNGQVTLECIARPVITQPTPIFLVGGGIGIATFSNTGTGDLVISTIVTGLAPWVTLLDYSRTVAPGGTGTITFALSCITEGFQHGEYLVFSNTDAVIGGMDVDCTKK